MLIEITTFRLAPGVDEAAFLAADVEAQAAAMTASPRAVRRTTARGEQGGWLVLTLWSGEPAEYAPGAPLEPFVDAGSLSVQHFQTLD